MLTGCAQESLLPATQSQIVVHAVLDLSRASQIIMVERTNGISGSDTLKALTNPVSGAVVRLTAPDGKVMIASPDAAIAGQYDIALTVYNTSLVAGGQYQIYIRTPKGEEVTGTTTIPVAVTGTASPMEQFNRTTDTLGLDLPALTGQVYEVRIRDSVPGNPDRLGAIPVIRNYVTFADSSTSFPGMMQTLGSDPLFAANSRVIVVVSVVDPNYYQYYHDVTDPFLGSPPSRLTGAVGVFGAVVPVRIRNLAVR